MSIRINKHTIIVPSHITTETDMTINITSQFSTTEFIRATYNDMSLLLEHEAFATTLVITDSETALNVNITSSVTINITASYPVSALDVDIVSDLTASYTYNKIRLLANNCVVLGGELNDIGKLISAAADIAITESGSLGELERLVSITSTIETTDVISGEGDADTISCQITIGVSDKVINLNNNRFQIMLL